MTHKSFGAQVYSNATSGVDSRGKSCRGQGMEKARDNPSMELGASQEQKGGYLGNTKETTRKSFFASLMDIHFHRKHKQCFFFKKKNWRGFISVSVTVSGARRIIVQAVERLQFLTRAEVIFFWYTVFVLCDIRLKAVDLDTGRWRQERTIHKYPYHDRLYLHFILWSGARKLCLKGVGMFQASACGEYISME